MGTHSSLKTIRLTTLTSHKKLFYRLDSFCETLFPCTANHDVWTVALLQSLNAQVEKILPSIGKEALVVVYPGNINIRHKVEIIAYGICRFIKPCRTGTK